MAVSKRLADHHRVAGKISVLYAHARGSYGEWAGTHVNNPERGEYVKQELAKRADFKEIVVTNAAGVATVYANDGGIVLAIG